MVHKNPAVKRTFSCCPTKLSNDEPRRAFPLSCVSESGAASGPAVFGAGIAGAGGHRRGRAVSVGGREANGKLPGICESVLLCAGGDEPDGAAAGGVAGGEGGADV